MPSFYLLFVTERSHTTVRQSEYHPPNRSLFPRHRSFISATSTSIASFEVIRPAFLLGPLLGVVRLGMHLELLEIRIDDLLTAIGALENGRSVGPTQWQHRISE